MDGQIDISELSRDRWIVGSAWSANLRCRASVASSYNACSFLLECNTPAMLFYVVHLRIKHVAWQIVELWQRFASRIKMCARLLLCTQLVTLVTLTAPNRWDHRDGKVQPDVSYSRKHHGTTKVCAVASGRWRVRSKPPPLTPRSRNVGCRSELKKMMDVTMMPLFLLCPSVCFVPLENNKSSQSCSSSIATNIHRQLCLVGRAH